jgi:SAM-dependent methyltransferase
VVAAAAHEAPANVRLVAGDVERLPFADASVDAVIGNAVLHHLRLDRTIPELLRVLRPAGRLCFAEPNMLNPQVFLERNVRWIGRRLDNSPGETAFVRWQLRRDLAALGVADLDVQPFDFLYPLMPRAAFAVTAESGSNMPPTRAMPPSISQSRKFMPGLPMK